MFVIIIIKMLAAKKRFIYASHKEEKESKLYETHTQRFTAQYNHSRGESFSLL